MEINDWDRIKETFFMLTFPLHFYIQICILIIMKYTVILEKEEDGGYSVQCLELPGAISQGETKEEALKNVKEAIELILEVLKEDADKLKEKAELKTVEVHA